MWLMVIMKVLSSLAVLAAIPLSNAKQIATYLIEEESAVTCNNAIGTTVRAVGSFTSFEAVPPWEGWASSYTSGYGGTTVTATENDPGSLVFGGCDNGGLCSVSIDSDVCTCYTPIDTQNSCAKVPSGPTPVPAPSAPTQPSTWKTFTVTASSTVSCDSLSGAKVCAVGSFSSLGAPAGWKESTSSDCEGKFYVGNALSPPSLSFGACQSSGSCTVSYDRRYCNCQGGCSEVQRDETMRMYRITEESDITCYSGGAQVCAVGPYTSVDMPSGWTDSFISDCEGMTYVATADSPSSLSFGGCDADGSCIVSLDMQLCECQSPSGQQVSCEEYLDTSMIIQEPQPTSSQPQPSLTPVETTSGAETKGVPQAVVALVVGLLGVMAGSW